MEYGLEYWWEVSEAHQNARYQEGPWTYATDILVYYTREGFLGGLEEDIGRRFRLDYTLI